MHLKKIVFNTLLRLVEFKISLNPHLTCLFRVGFFSRHFSFILDILKFLGAALRLRVTANTAARASHQSPTFSMVDSQAKTVSNTLNKKSGKSSGTHKETDS